jgi:hypothetical protein
VSLQRALRAERPPRRSGMPARHKAFNQAKAGLQRPHVGQVCPTYAADFQSGKIKKALTQRHRDTEDTETQRKPENREKHEKPIGFQRFSLCLCVLCVSGSMLLWFFVICDASHRGEGMSDYASLIQPTRSKMGSAYCLACIVGRAYLPDLGSLVKRRQVFNGPMSGRYARPTRACLPLAPETSGERVPRQGRERGRRGALSRIIQKVTVASLRWKRRSLPALPGPSPAEWGRGKQTLRLDRFSSTLNALSGVLFFRCIRCFQGSSEKFSDQRSLPSMLTTAPPRSRRRHSRQKCV